VSAVGLASAGSFTIDVVRDGIIQRIHKSPEAATVGGLSRDGALLSYTHAERGDSRNPDLRVATVDGTVVAELSDGPGHGVAGVGWSPVAGDQRLLVLRNVTGQRRPAILAADTGEPVDVDV